MLPILANLKNSISCSLKKLNNSSQNASSDNNSNNKHAHLSIKNSLDSGINNLELRSDEENRQYKKLFDKKKSKSLTKREKTYQDYMTKRFSSVTTRSEFYLNSSASKENSCLHENDDFDPDVNYLDDRKSKRRMSMHGCVLPSSTSTASLPVNFDASNLNLTNKLAKSQRTKSTRLKSFSSFFKKFSLFGMSKFFL